MYELIIAEKAKTAEKIANALSITKSKHIGQSGILYYSEQKHILVGHTSGHIAKRHYSNRYKHWATINIANLLRELPVVSYEKKYEIYFKTILQSYSITTLALYTDSDIEGELIAADVVNLCTKFAKDLKIIRYKTSALTASAILKGIECVKSLDTGAAASAEIKHWIDLQWGSVLTVLFTLYAKRLFTIGRVQTPVLNLIVERYKQITEFKPKSYYIHTIYTQWNAFTSEPVYDLKNILSPAVGRIITPHIAIKENVVRVPPRPLNSVDLLKFASKLRTDGKTVMALAETLYLNGLITYPRTDSRYTTYETIHDILTKLNKLETLTCMPYAIEVGGPDPAHPPILPTSDTKALSNLKQLELRLYTYILEHYISIIKGPNVVDIYTYTIEVEGLNFTFVQEKTKRQGFKDNAAFSPYTEGTPLHIVDIECVTKQTKPPSKYTEGLIVKKMQSLGIGTKSTRHTFLPLLRNRKYVTGFIPTTEGIKLINVLATHIGLITSANLTAEIEHALKEVENNVVTKQSVFETYTQKLTSIVKMIMEQKHNIICEIRAKS